MKLRKKQLKKVQQQNEKLKKLLTCLLTHLSITTSIEWVTLFGHMTCLEELLDQRQLINQV